MQFAESAQILNAVVRVLEEVVAPALEPGEAKGQLRAAVGLLDNLAAHLGHGADALSELSELRALLGDPAPVLPAVDVEAALSAARAELIARLAVGAESADHRAWMDACRASMERWAIREEERLRPLRYYEAVNGL